MDGLYHLPATASFKDLEDLGMKTAQVAIAHWDLDGHPANGRMVAGRLPCKGRACDRDDKQPDLWKNENGKYSQTYNRQGGRKARALD